MAKILPLHRVVELPVRTLDDIAREHEGQPDLIEQLRQNTRYPSTIERITDALDSPRMIGFYLGFYAGCMATVGLAMLWSRF